MISEISDKDFTPIILIINLSKSTQNANNIKVY